MIRYSVTIFFSALLLFLIQPLAARWLLPVLGGSSTVWIAAMMFFQIALLLGYLYAHLLRRCFSPRVSWFIHLVALSLSILLLDFSHLQTESKSLGVSLAAIQRLAIAVGFPFCILAGTAPLIQAWQSTSHQHRESYRLYAFSNAGSLLALLAYPFLMERLTLSNQSLVWIWIFLSMVLLLYVSGRQITNRHQWPDAQAEDENCTGSRSITSFVVLAWVFLSATASALLIATTNMLCLEVAAYPFLWILPLTLYLVSFIICFERAQWYRRRQIVPLFVFAVFAGILLLHLGPNAGLILQATGFGLVVFAGSMVCHGELYRIRPTVRYLTVYYLCLALGGAIGSVFAVLVAPVLFDHYFEFHIALLNCLLAAILLVWRDVNRKLLSNRYLYAMVFSAFCAASPVVCSLLFLMGRDFQQDLVFRARNEYGIVSVRDKGNYRRMFNGHTNHGGQFLDDAKQQLPSAYYSEGSGVDLAFKAARQSNESLNVCVIGLGTGSMLSYAEVDDQFRFYEINPIAVESARLHFSYLSNTDAAADVVVGDGRFEIQNENLSGTLHRFDLIFVDAFSSDSIPVHLLTHECIDLYLQNLKEDGILVFHITNRFVDLLPVVRAIEDEYQLASVLVNHQNLDFELQTKWVLMSRNDLSWKDAEVGAIDPNWGKEVSPVKWTDQSSSVAPLVIWSGAVKLGR